MVQTDQDEGGEWLWQERFSHLERQIVHPRRGEISRYWFAVVIGDQ